MIAFSTAEKGIPLLGGFKPLKANGYMAQAHYCADCKIVIAATQP